MFFSLLVIDLEIFDFVSYSKLFRVRVSSLRTGPFICVKRTAYMFLWPSGCRCTVFAVNKALISSRFHCTNLEAMCSRCLFVVQKNIKVWNSTVDTEEFNH